MKCICGVSKITKLFSAANYKIARCIACGQVRTVTPKGFVRKQLYIAEDTSIYIEKEHMFRILFRQIVRFILQFKPSGILVDIGAGIGLLADEAKNAGFDVTGFEPSKQMADAARKHFGIKLVNGYFSPKKIREKADVVVINHVLEHLSDPYKTVSQIKAALKLHGLLVIGVPNFGSFLAMWKKGRWQSLIPDQHRWHFTLQTLDRLVLPFGFVRLGMQQENHERTMHPWWKHPAYLVLDTIAIITGRAEAMLVAYQKI